MVHLPSFIASKAVSCIFLACPRPSSLIRHRIYIAFTSRRLSQTSSAGVSLPCQAAIGLLGSCWEKSLKTSKGEYT